MPGPLALDDLDDDALVRRTLAGNRDAFGVLVGRYQGRVTAICAQIAGDYEQANDLAQDAFLHAYANLERYQPGRSFFAWLYRVAVNGALNYRNRKKPAPVPDAEGAEAMMRVTDPAISPQERVERMELARRVQEAVGQLPPDYAAVLALRYGADLDYAEMAATLGLPMGTVKARLFRAKVMLRPLLQALHEEEG